MDDDGFLYFIGRKDDMIKTSGYRVSPTEIEEIGFESGLVKEVAALGVADDRLGQTIVIVAVSSADTPGDDAAVLDHYRSAAPAYMVPARIVWRDTLPRSANGKIDRQGLANELQQARSDENT